MGELEQTVAQYRAGLEAEIALLRQLRSLPPPTADGVTSEALTALADARDRVMAHLASLERDLVPLRMTLAANRGRLQWSHAFAEIVALHRDARQLVAGLVADDHRALEALRAAERDRRFAADEIEKGEVTLAAYRRVVAPPLEGARIVNRRG